MTGLTQHCAAACIILERFLRSAGQYFSPVTKALPF
jgi:hypothetical protein